jgi:four helix bundle protein
MERVDFKIKEEDKNNVIKRTYKFVLSTLYIAQKLPNNPVTNKIIVQLVGFGASMGSNTEEASAGFSKNDFTFKMSIVSKEARETNYWFRLLRKNCNSRYSKCVAGKALDRFLEQESYKHDRPFSALTHDHSWE